MSKSSGTPLTNFQVIPIASLRPRPGNAKTHSKKQLKQIAASIKAFGFLTPIVADEKNTILAGHGRFQAAKREGLKTVPVVRYDHLSEAQKRAYVIADNKIAEASGWDRELLVLELGELAELLPPEKLDLSVTGFAAPEYDALQKDLGHPHPEPGDEAPPPPARPVTRRGDVWVLGKHRLMCGDARKRDDLKKLMAGSRASACFCDPPFNRASRAIGGRGRVQHRNFAFAAGEMSQPQYRVFLCDTLANGIDVSIPGAVHFICIDWRHIADLIEVAGPLYDQMLNLVVWNKSNAGQGSFYRSQHELIGVFRVGGHPHQNNVELGRFGRNRSNIWVYAGVNTFGKDRLKTLASHPTVKPIALVADAFLDCTARGEIVLDQFAGSGTTTLAAEKVGRIAYCVEYDPAYVDVAVRRWEAATKQEAILEASGRTFEAVQQHRQIPRAPAAQTKPSPRTRQRTPQKGKPRA